jgi:glycosyltransferase involved in cell wall biosynthesis
MITPSTEISVIIPTFNRADALRRCLEALGSQTLPAAEFEVVVVVDGSTDGTAGMLSIFEPSFPLRVHEQENAGPGAARNAGAGLALGRYALFIDDDIVAAPELVETHLRCQSEHPRTVGIGRVTVELGPRADGFARYFARWYADHNQSLAEDAMRPTYMDCYSNNVSLPLGPFHELGGFATDLPRSEDVELGYRLAAQRFAFRFLPEAVGVSRYDKGFPEIRALAERAGIAGVELARRHPGMAASLQLRSFCGGGRLAAPLCGLLFALGAPIRSFRVASALVPGSGPVSRKWYRFLYEYCYWRGVRQAASDGEWRRLARGGRG